ncbi:MAG: zinc ribbon domain-containing protein [Dehalococcoidia bacterium]|nr:zinc ribbon domain-containing protein [Dehalococcoidia bacterium]MDD5493471.1 zinc ribbon domain-containing protein [Dehalococcoidia bacterium]
MQQTATCPNCGSQNAANQQFCVACGAHIAGAPKQLPHVPIVTGVAAPPPGVPGVIQPPPLTSLPPLPAALQTRQRVEIAPTWGLAWGLFWRMFFLWLFLFGLIFLVYVVVRLVLGYTTIF